MKPTRLTLTVTMILLLVGCATAQHDSAAYREPPPRAAERIPTLQQADQGPAAGNAIAQARYTDDDFWEQMRSGFDLPGAQQQAVQRQIGTYSRNPRQVEKIFERGTPYMAYILREVEKRGHPHEIALLPFVESAYDPFAYSHGRAAGLWQFIPGTAKLYGLEQDWWYDGRRDVIASTDAALDYLDQLHAEFEGDWLLALAAYNSGSGTVRAAIRRNERAGKPTDFWHLKLPSETASYVPRLLAISAIVGHPERYAVALAPVDPEPAFEVVDTRGQLDIGIAAELAGIDTEELYQFNPGFNRWATHPDGPHRLAIPSEKTEAFLQGLQELPAEQRLKWVRHDVKRGDTLSQIAQRYDTTIAVLRTTNRLQGSNIRIGQHLLVPVAAHDPEDYRASLAARQVRAQRSSGAVNHVVSTGESLWSIARRHGVQVNQIIRWNRLDSGGAIRPGQQLVLYGGAAAVPSGKQIRTIRYTVRNGDSLYGISRKYNVAVSDLRRWNDLPEGKYLQPGQRLKLYIDITDVAQNS
ncbi:MAG: LysM peptidoglycan-binding domain-containing protein [Pseudomonadota bacterium]